MSNKKILISFVGGNDINSDNAAIEQILKNYPDISEVYLFLTKGLEAEFLNYKRLNYYKKISNSRFKIINCNIENPTDQKEIYECIKDELIKIKNKINLEKDIGFINLSSGTPDIKSVWSVLLAINELPQNRFHGIYAPNPKFDNKIRLDDLAFYKNSYLYNTIKLFIDNSDYLALSELLASNQDNDLTDEAFLDIVDFAKYRFTCDYENAYKIYKDKFLDRYFEYEIPTDIFQKSVEYYNSAKISEMNKDYFSSVIKLAIVRENLLEYLIEKLLGYENIGFRKNDDKPYVFDKERILKNEPALKDFLDEKQKNADTENKIFNYSGEINAYSKTLIFEYIIKKSSDNKLNKISKFMNSISDLPKQRNNAAHKITTFKYNKSWIKNIDTIIKLISEYFGLQTNCDDIYQKINNILNNQLRI